MVDCWLQALWNEHTGNFAAYGSECPSFLERVSETQKASQIEYAKLISRTEKYTPYTHPAEMDKGMQYRRLIKCIKWYEAYQSAPKCTKRTKLVEFQFKLLRRRISTNGLFAKIGIDDDRNCSLCNEELEKLTHLFWSCSKVTTFWNSLIQRLTLSQIIPQNYRINISTGLGLTPDAPV